MKPTQHHEWIVPVVVMAPAVAGLLALVRR